MLRPAAAAGLDVAIIGGGLGGLAAAIALEQAGHRAVVFEQTRAFRSAGAGISLWPNAVKVLDALGVADAVASLSGRMDRMGYCDRSGQPMCEFELAPLYQTAMARACPVARSDLQAVLVETLGADRIRFGARCVGVSDRGGSAVVELDDGRTHPADLVVAADGTHSRLRPWVAGRPVTRRYVGYVNVNTIVPADASIVPPGVWRTWVGDGRRVSVMPIGGDRLYAFFDLPQDLDRASTPAVPVLEEIQQAFAGWAAPVTRLVDKLQPDRLNRVPIHDLPDVERWHRGRVVLLGDAVHTMAPDLGQGGGQALEDAWVLARCLAADLNHAAADKPPSDREISTALARYQQARQPRTADIARRARRRAAVTHAEDPAITEEWYSSLRGDPGPEIIAGLVQSAVTGPC